MTSLAIPSSSPPRPAYTGDAKAAGVTPEALAAAKAVVDKAERVGGKVHDVTLLPGDGIGPEVANATMLILAGAGAAIRWDFGLIGAAGIAAASDALPKQSLDQVAKTRVALKGPTGTPPGGGHVSANVRLRQAFDLYQCIRPVKSIDGIETPFKDVDLVIFRENTEGAYTGKAVEMTPGTIVGMDIVTEKGSRRIIEAAFEYARAHGRKTVTCVHKANILKLPDGTFLRIFNEIAKQYPDIKANDQIIDSFCAKAVQRPQQFDVIVTRNLYGDIISDLCAALVGGLGVVPGVNLGPNGAIYEATHGTADDIAGQNKANPTAMLMSAVAMLRDLGEAEAGARVERALLDVLADPERRTGDLGGKASTSEFTAHVLRAIERLAKAN